MKNWLFYYPLERFLAHFSDRIITINQEDYRAAQKFHYKKGGHAEYVPGVGIEPKRFEKNEEIRNEIRNSMGIKAEETVLLSVGEINKNKNHKVVIEALAKLGRKNIRYVICGVGPLMQSNRELAEKLGVGDQVFFAGYRTDVQKFYQAADLFVIASFREGLPVAPMEAMSAGIPCIASKIRGNIDLFSESELLFRPSDSESLCAALKKTDNKTLMDREVARNSETLKLFSMEEAVYAMRNIYIDVAKEIWNT